MRFKLVTTLLILAFLNCSSEPDMQSSESSPPLTDVLTLELSFGADNLPEEYLLTSSQSASFNNAYVDVKIDNNENILIADEYKIKIYDSNGNPVTMIGGRGEGPGEFGRSRYPIFYISPKGYITHHRSTSSTTGIYNIFGSDYSLLESKNYLNIPKYNELKNEFEPDQIYIYSMVALDESRIIYRISGFDSKNNMFNFIIYAKSNKDVSIISRIIEPRLSKSDPDMGFYRWALLPDETIILTCSVTDVVFNEHESVYSINLISLETEETCVIKHPFTPEEFPQDVREKTIERFKKQMESLKDNPQFLPMMQKNYEQIKKVFSGITYKTPIKNLLTDGHYIFVFTTRKNDDGEIFMDVFDAQKKQYIASAWFPFIPKVIKNGYAYIIAENDEGFEIIEKYKIDPAVYER